jgi:hypothetical protein
MTRRLNQRELIINLENGESEIRPILHRIGVDSATIYA